MFDAHVLKVFISAPGDTADEVATVTKAIHGWNSSRAEAAGSILLPRFWKQNAVPRTGNTAQNIINSQLLDDADIVIALFDSRLGEATESAVSGTAEEIERATGAGKKVHVWFSNEPIDRNSINIDELKRLQDFQKELQSKALYGDYIDLTDLEYKVRDALESDINEMGLGAASVNRKGEHALPVVSVKNRSKNDYRLVVTNRSDTVTADQLTVDFGELRHTVYREDEEPMDLVPYSDIGWPMGLDMGSPRTATITLKWLEDGEPHERIQKINSWGN